MKHKVFMDIYSEEDYNRPEPWVNKSRICTLVTEAGPIPYSKNSSVSVHFSTQLQDWVYYLPNQWDTQAQTEERIKLGWKFFSAAVGTEAHTVTQAFGLRQADNDKRKEEYDLQQAELSRGVYLVFYVVIAIASLSGLAWEAYKYFGRMQ